MQMLPLTLMGLPTGQAAAQAIPGSPEGFIENLAAAGESLEAMALLSGAQGVVGQEAGIQEPKPPFQELDLTSDSDEEIAALWAGFTLPLALPAPTAPVPSVPEAAPSLDLAASPVTAPSQGAPVVSAVLLAEGLSLTASEAGSEFTAEEPVFTSSPKSSEALADAPAPFTSEPSESTGSLNTAAASTEAESAHVPASEKESKAAVPSQIGLTQSVEAGSKSQAAQVQSQHQPIRVESSASEPGQVQAPAPQASPAQAPQAQAPQAQAPQVKLGGWDLEVRSTGAGLTAKTLKFIGQALPAEEGSSPVALPEGDTAPVQASLKSPSRLISLLPATGATLAKKMLDRLVQSMTDVAQPALEQGSQQEEAEDAADEFAASDLASAPRLSSTSPLTESPSLAKSDEAKPLPKPVAAAAEALRDLLEVKRPGQVTIVLRPHDLGTVTVKVDFRGSEVLAEISATSSEVRQSLAAHKADLVQSLELKGHSLTSFHITTDKAESSSPNQQNLGQQNLSQHSLSQNGQGRGQGTPDSAFTKQDFERMGRLASLAPLSEASFSHPSGTLSGVNVLA